MNVACGPTCEPFCGEQPKKTFEKKAWWEFVLWWVGTGYMKSAVFTWIKNIPSAIMLVLRRSR